MMPSHYVQQLLSRNASANRSFPKPKHLSYLSIIFYTTSTFKSSNHLQACSHQSPNDILLSLASNLNSKRLSPIPTTPSAASDRSTSNLSSSFPSVPPTYPLSLPGYKVSKLTTRPPSTLWRRTILPTMFPPPSWLRSSAQRRLQPSEENGEWIWYYELLDNGERLGKWGWLPKETLPEAAAAQESYGWGLASQKSSQLSTKSLLASHSARIPAEKTPGATQITMGDG